MPHSEAVTAVLTDHEPPDGTRLILEKSDGEYQVIVRDDDAARSWDAFEDDHWFGDAREDPMALHQHLKYARAVYALGEQLAVFN
jgi:hypothetical protein